MGLQVIYLILYHLMVSIPKTRKQSKNHIGTYYFHIYVIFIGIDLSAVLNSMNAVACVGIDPTKVPLLSSILSQLITQTNVQLVLCK